MATETSQIHQINFLYSKNSENEKERMICESFRWADELDLPNDEILLRIRQEN